MWALLQENLEKNSISLREVEEPQPGIGEVKIRVRAAGICGTDIHGISSLNPPVILGHEFSGEVVEIGQEVKRIKVGDRVTSETTIYRCGVCPYCREGFFNLCPERKGIGSGANGSFAEYIVVPEFAVHVLPEKLSFEEGAVLEPLACATRGVLEQTRIGGNDKVVVLGPGPLGILVSWVAKTRGASVILVGKQEDELRFQVAKEGEVDYLLNLDEVNIKEAITQEIDPYGVDVVFECSGALPAVSLGLEVLKKRGRYVQMGIIHKPVIVDFDQYLFSRELKITGSRTQTTSSWEKAINLLENTNLPLEKIVTHILPLSQWQEGFELTKNRKAIKVVLKP
ncbi:MAG: L-iditol 2-dehydrogenase [Candidatus Atribacteria bacterium]|nr:L-iditol 2-dehydrogenase [Candidatus Atribacteria bacterium]